MWICLLSFWVFSCPKTDPATSFRLTFCTFRYKLGVYYHKTHDSHCLSATYFLVSSKLLRTRFSSSGSNFSPCLFAVFQQQLTFRPFDRNHMVLLAQVLLYLLLLALFLPFRPHYGFLLLPQAHHNKFGSLQNKACNSDFTTISDEFTWSVTSFLGLVTAQTQHHFAQHNCCVPYSGK